jgi:hypothetical protein
MFGANEIAYKVALGRHAELARDAERLGPIYAELRERRPSLGSRISGRLGGLAALRVRIGKNSFPGQKLAPEQ